MLDSTIKCPYCCASVPDHEASCPECDQTIYPNWRKAKSEADVLERRYDEAVDHCRERGVVAQLHALEELAEKARPVTNMKYGLCIKILRDEEKYKNIYQLNADNRKRGMPLILISGKRIKVDKRLFPECYENLVCAVLSSDGLGLTAYDEVAVCWDVTSDHLENRLSLVEDHSYQYFDKYHLVNSKNQPPLGHIAVWQDRKWLVVAKHGLHLNWEAEDKHLPALLMYEGEQGVKDDFMEIFIYINEGLSKENMNIISMQINPWLNKKDEEYFGGILRSLCYQHKIEFRPFESA